MARDYDRVNGTSPDLDRAQKRAQDGVERNKPPFHSGAHVEFEITRATGSAVEASRVKVAHKLGRKPQGYFPVVRSGNGNGMLSLVAMDDKTLTFELHADSASDVTHNYKLWVH